MAVGVLGQSIPAAGTLTAVLTNGFSSRTVVSTLTACNQGSQPTTIRVSVAIQGAADTPKQYIWYNVPVSGYDTFSATIGMTLGANDVLRCWSGNGQVSFNVFGESA